MLPRRLRVFAKIEAISSRSVIWFTRLINCLEFRFWLFRMCNRWKDNIAGAIESDSKEFVISMLLWDSRWTGLEISRLPSRDTFPLTTRKTDDYPELPLMFVRFSWTERVLSRTMVSARGKSSSFPVFRNLCKASWPFIRWTLRNSATCLTKISGISYSSHEFPRWMINWSSSGEGPCTRGMSTWWSGCVERWLSSMTKKKRHARSSRSFADENQFLIANFKELFNKSKIFVRSELLY